MSSRALCANDEGKVSFPRNSGEDVVVAVVVVVMQKFILARKVNMCGF